RAGEVALAVLLDQLNRDRRVGVAEAAAHVRVGHQRAVLELEDTGRGAGADLVVEGRGGAERERARVPDGSSVREAGPDAGQGWDIGLLDRNDRARRHARTP